MGEPVWLQEARKHLGTSEIPGPRTDEKIRGWLRRLRAWWDDDETPWCGVFVAACVDAAGYPIPKYWMRARAWEDWGTPIWGTPPVGAIVVFDGGKLRPGGGHVGFVVGKDTSGRLLVLGGNQANKVSIAPFDPARVLAYRLPPSYPIPRHKPLPVLALDSLPTSNQEA